MFCGWGLLGVVISCLSWVFVCGFSGFACLVGFDCKLRVVGFLRGWYNIEFLVVWGGLFCLRWLGFCGHVWFCGFCDYAWLFGVWVPAVFVVVFVCDVVLRLEVVT